MSVEVVDGSGIEGANPGIFGSPLVLVGVGPIVLVGIAVVDGEVVVALVTIPGKTILGIMFGMVIVALADIRDVMSVTVDKVDVPFLSGSKLGFRTLSKLGSRKGNTGASRHSRSHWDSRVQRSGWCISYCTQSLRSDTSFKANSGCRDG